MAAICINSNFSEQKFFNKAKSNDSIYFDIFVDLLNINVSNEGEFQIRICLHKNINASSKGNRKRKLNSLQEQKSMFQTTYLLYGILKIFYA